MVSKIDFFDMQFISTHNHQEQNFPTDELHQTC